MKRRDYPVSITINGRKILRVVIDPHYEVKHGGSIDDETILKLVATLDGRTFLADASKDGFEYFRNDPINLNGIRYMLIWLMEKNEIYIGVVNAFKRR